MKKGLTEKQKVYAEGIAQGRFDCTMDNHQQLGRIEKRLNYLFETLKKPEVNMKFIEKWVNCYPNIHRGTRHVRWKKMLAEYLRQILIEAGIKIKE